MIKIDYEGAWKELKKNIEPLRKLCLSSITELDHAILFHMNELEQKHTHNYIDIKSRSDEEIADYCLKKYAEMYLELVELKGKLKELSKEEAMPIDKTFLKR